MTRILPRPALPLLATLLVLLGGCRTTAALPSDSEASGAAYPIVLVAPPPDWQAYVDRSVRIDVPLTISGNARVHHNGELTASFGGRLYMPTERALPGTAAAVVAADNARRALVLALAHQGDGAATGEAPAPWRSGTVLEGVQGTIRSRAKGLVLEIEPPLRAMPAPRPTVPDVAGDVRLASLNLENLFNGDGRGEGFPTPRGARSPDEYLRQRGKLVATLRALDADIVALMELENDGEGPDSSLAQLVGALNDRGDHWRFVANCATRCPQPDTVSGDHPIRVGLIYRTDRVAPIGEPATLIDGPFRERSRSPLAQGFRAGHGPVFTVVAVHLKSKGCSEAEADDRDQRDGQACWNATRLDSARRLDTWLKSDPTRSGSDLVAILGDFNAYAMEDPIRLLRDAGWQDGLAGSEDVYSYVFDAQAGRLDHVLLSPTIARRVSGASVWHANADEAPNVGYRGDISGDITPAPWRSSDHDPLLIGLRLRTP